MQKVISRWLLSLISLIVFLGGFIKSVEAKNEETNEANENIDDEKIDMLIILLSKMMFSCYMSFIALYKIFWRQQKTLSLNIFRFTIDLSLTII